MKNVLLVAKREFRQITSMKSFWLTLLLLPVALSLGPIIGEYLGDDEAQQVILYDRSGGDTAQAIERRFALDEDRYVLSDLSRYVRRYELEDADPDALWAQFDRWYTDADVAAFRQAGGLDTALAAIDRVKPEGTPDYDPPQPAYEFVSPPADLAAADPEDLEDAARELMDADSDDAPDAVVVIGEDYPRIPVVQVIANDEPRTSFVTTLQDVLTGDLRTRMMTDQGMSADAAGAVNTAAPAIAVSTPPPGGGAREAVLVRSIVPLALAYILMMALMLSGSWMLQSSVEERSNKLIESLLACIRPEELMHGKLFGTIAVGLSMLAVWVVCAGVAVFWAQGTVAQFIRPALEPLASPGIILAILYFFLAGYVAVSIIFLAIGAMADSMSDAQGYLMPVILAIMLPIFFLIQAVLLGNEGIAVQILTWVPLWTPFAVLARLGTGIETWELIGAGLVLAAFVAAEFVLLGRLFRNSLLASGQKPTLRQLYDRMRRS
ncbi:ABC transporter permease [Aurantiacibacter spongiae]|uniref:ABC transporter permease n=1 Tax=Aurantiacibacter spongiae TaxID=2488860 RepID=A0A3N5CR95_9SPHN|nr:ABC transporter permease [Aurantiacibacter spongiae]RPF71594.1 ABC transporter permease [Aurantiacibacter spongiae]